MRSPPPSLLSLTVNSALLNISRINDLSHLPDHIVLELFRRTLEAGKLNEKVLRVFMASGNEEVFAIIKALKIKIDLTPIVPTRCDENFIMHWSRR